MNDRKKLTRRAALALMAGGGTLAASETVGFTSIVAQRVSAVDTAADNSAFVRLVGVGSEENPAPYGTPHEVTVQNQLGETVDISVSSDDFGVGTGTVRDVANGDFAYFTVKIPDGETSSGDLDAKRGTITVNATGSGMSVEADRTFRLLHPILDRINVWYDAGVRSTVLRAIDSDVQAENDESVRRWEPREESADSGVDLDQSTTGDRPRYRLAGEQILPTLEFRSGDFLYSSQTTDFGKNAAREADLFFVVDPKSDASTGQILRFEQDSNNRIAYQFDTGSVDTVEIELAGNAVTLDGAPSTTDPFLVAVRLSEGDRSSEVTATVFYNTKGAVGGGSGSRTGAIDGGSELTLPDATVTFANSPFAGQISETIVYDTHLANFSTIRNSYLAERWGLETP